ncbi:hypothetical protein Golax_002331 [Gossypium laxum]|uniref:DUF4283 domain-containing protein n=1 Tax=Gossypium laxum TaxID=34288 RepID=A0A7J9AQZ2_9ROSI|nr:hypothetical protein [Gossypium laxum]
MRKEDETGSPVWGVRSPKEQEEKKKGVKKAILGVLFKICMVALYVEGVAAPNLHLGGFDRERRSRVCLVFGGWFFHYSLAYLSSSMVDVINVLLERLNFLEKELKRVINTNMKSANIQGYEAWVVGKIMSREKVNREFMYRVLKYLWFTKEEVNFVALNEGVTLVKFGAIGYRTRNLSLTPIYNIPIEQTDRLVAIDMGKAIGEVVAIDWRDRDGGWTNYIRIRFKIDVLRPLRKVVHLVSSESVARGSSQTRGKWRNGIKILEKKINLSEGIKSDKDGDGEENDLTMLKGKEKSRAGEEEFESCSPTEKHPTKSTRDGGGKMRSQSWDILRTVGRSVKDDWVMGGNFNTIINEAEKEGGRRKSRVTMEEFRDVKEELTLVDIKTNKGLFTWVNNREGNNMVKERLDTFLIFANAIDNFPFFATNVVRQTNSNRDAILMDTLGRKPRKNFKDPRLFFKYDECWEK